MTAIDTNKIELVCADNGNIEAISSILIEATDWRIEWAKGKAQMAGRQYLRLDCDRTQPKLCAYYEGLGFKLHSERQMGIYDFARYEMSLLSNSG